MKKFLILTAALLQLSFSGTAEGQIRELQQEQAKKPVQIVRIARNGAKQAVRLDTARIVMRNQLKDEELTVELIGAIHVGEKEYYAELNKLFQEYEVVNYELVAPKGTRPDKDAEKSFLGKIQGLGAKVIGLSHQLEEIDYSKDNFVHADLSMEELKVKGAERGETMMSLILGAASDMLRQGNLAQAETVPGDLPDVMAMLQQEGGAELLKRQLIEQLANSKAGLGRTLEQYIIEDRDQACIDELTKQIKSGKKKIAIFYGAAHLPDLVRRVRETHDLYRVDVDWVTAIDMSKPLPTRPPAKIAFEAVKDDFIKQAMKNPEVQAAIKRVIHDPEVQDFFRKILKELD